jgi:hypothetical protein
MKPMKGTIAAMAKPSAAPKPAKTANHPIGNLKHYAHPKGGKC